MTTKIFSYGVDELDELLGNIDPGTMMIIEGYPGTGKTGLAISMMCKNAYKYGHKTLFITLVETPEKLIKKAEKIGCNIKDAIEKGFVKIIRPPLLADRELTNLISELIIEEGFGKGYDLVIVDNITTPLKLLKTYTEQRSWIQTVFYDLVSKNQGVLVFIAEVMEPKPTSLFLAEYVADIVMELKYELGPMGTYERRIIIKKHRFQPLNIASYPFDIGSHGFIILNYVAKEKREKLLAKRKPLRVSCEPFQKIIGEFIEPGTSIFILNKNPDYIVLPNQLYKYMFITAIKHTATNGLRLGLITYDRDIAKHITSYFEKHKEIPSDKYKIVVLDPTLVSPSTINRVVHELIVYEGVDLLFLSGIERIMEITGFDLIKPFIAYVMRLQKLTGVTTIRFYNLYDPSRMPLQYLAWSDIVITMDIDEEGKTYHQIKKTGKGTLKIYDEEFSKCVEFWRCE